MKAYYKVMPGAKSVYIEQCLKEGFVGTDYGIRVDLKDMFVENWKDFNKVFLPIYFEANPDKSKIAAGLAGGTTWVIGYGAKIGDMVISPDGDGHYHVGEIISNYHYCAGDILPHRRGVKWYNGTIDRNDMSESLQASINATGVYITLSDHSKELDQLITGDQPLISSSDQTIEDVSAFALEKHLEDFLVSNWSNTELGKHYDIYEDEGEIVGQQFPSDTGPIDILAVSKDRKELLVIELKKGRASDAVVGQIQRYMGYVKDDLAENGQKVKGIIIALEDDLRIRRALSVTRDIDFYRYRDKF